MRDSDPSLKWSLLASFVCITIAQSVNEGQLPIFHQGNIYNLSGVGFYFRWKDSCHLIQPQIEDDLAIKPSLEVAR